MKKGNKVVEFLKKYRHGWVFLYAFIYLPWFLYLERHVTNHYHVVQTTFDEMLPFIEFFIVPYLLWFGFIAVVFAYFFLTDVKGFYRLAALTFTGMTVFLIICTVFPNGQDLRPVVFERQNIFVDMVRLLYRTDTCTNVFPSLHVFNTLGACIAIHESEKLSEKKGICLAADVLGGLIILATMFLKQHSVLDVVAAFGMAYVLYQIVYSPERKSEPGFEKRPVLQNK